MRIEAGRRVLNAFRHSGRRERAAAAEVWIPLADAARALQASQHGGDLDRLSRGLGESDESLLTFWARRVAEVGVPVYGLRIMGTKPEALAVTAMRAGKLLHGATRLDPGLGQPLQEICALRVIRSDLDRYLAGSSRKMAA